jgi:hypothetical protein
LSKHKVIVHIEILGFMMPFFHNTFSLMQLNRHMKTTVYLTMSIMHTFGCQENCNLFIVFEKQKRFSLQLGLWDNWIVIWFCLWGFCIQICMCFLVVTIHA